MTSDSLPHQPIECFPPSGETYLKAIEVLKSRNGNDEFLLNSMLGNFWP